MSLHAAAFPPGPVNVAAARMTVDVCKGGDAAAERHWNETRERSNVPQLQALFEQAKTFYGPFFGGADEAPEQTGPMVFREGRFRRLPFGIRDTPTQANPLSPERRAELVRMAQGDREYLSHAREETGMGVSPEELARQTVDRAEVRAQSHTLAKRLDFAGKCAYRNDAFALWVWWVHSKKFQEIPNFRRICLLPYVAAIVRASKLAALEYFLERNPFCRFWTFTTGDRCGLSDLRARCQWLHRRLSLLNAFIREKYGVELVFRSTEFGTLEFDDAGNKREGGGGSVEFDANGEPLFHVHAHVVVHSLVGFIHPDRWKAMFDDVWAFWGFNWDGGKKGASGVIRNARECCKYVTKPGDMLKLTPEQLGRMHEAVFRLKLCQPMGTLREEIRARKKAGKTLRRYRKSGRVKGVEWREVWDQNKWATESEADREALWNLMDARKMAEETKAAARAKPGQTPRIREKDSSWCAVFSRLSPSVGPAGLKEPRVVVGGTRFDARSVEAHPLVARLWAQTVQEWESGLCISVHTGTPTVADPPGCSPGDAETAWPAPEFCQS